MNLSKVKSIQFKILLMFIIFTAIMMIIVGVVMHSGIKKLEENLIGDRLRADINYIEDLIGRGNWNIRDGIICLGNTFVGDGTEEYARLAPFLEHQNKTGTFSYVFIKCSDEGLVYVPSTPTQEGYQQGHFLRVAGSTRDPNGNSIVGTYIDKKVADVLDEYGTYSGEANVAGGRIYCLYNVLTDKDGEVIGAIVVGRNVSELTSQIDGTTGAIMTVIFVAMLVSCALLVWMLTRWTNSVKKIAVRLENIEKGNLPKEPLKMKTLDEMGMLIVRINSLVESLKENEILRLKSETDQLTGIANRFGLNAYVEKVMEYCRINRKSFAVGLIDIDYFKQYNDNYGHQVGDECIVMIADIMRNMVQNSSIFCARFGGDEFIFIMDSCEPGDVEKTASELKIKITEKNREHLYSEASDRVTVSQGYCFGTPDGNQSFNDFIHTADEALYEVKENGRNNYRIRIMDR